MYVLVLKSLQREVDACPALGWRWALKLAFRSQTSSFKGQVEEKELFFHCSQLFSASFPFGREYLQCGTLKCTEVETRDSKLPGHLGIAAFLLCVFWQRQPSLFVCLLVCLAFQSVQASQKNWCLALDFCLPHSPLGAQSPRSWGPSGRPASSSPGELVYGSHVWEFPLLYSIPFCA